MARYEGILAAVVTEVRSAFKARLHAALVEKYGDGFVPAEGDNPDKLPHGGFADIAKVCGVTPVNVRLWISGKVFPDNAHIAKLAAFFGLSVKKFLGGDLFRYYKEA